MKAARVPERPKVSQVDGVLFKEALTEALNWLGQSQDEVNRLNVFPVPDGDTGTNMLLTLQSAVDDIRDLSSKEIAKVAALAAHGSLMGARGNSGVILSQIFRGFAKGVHGSASIDAMGLASALQEASTAAYRAVVRPTEGTMLTVARDAALAGMSAAQSGADIVGVLKAAAVEAARAVGRTPQQLPILREAGVVDAGGFGLQLILEGLLRRLGDDSEAPIARAPVAKAGAVELELPETGWGYCTEFMLQGDGLDVEEIRLRIIELGDSAMVVGEPDLVRVHVHTAEPAAVIAFASSVGQISRLKVDDMTQQHRILLRDPIAAPSTDANHQGPSSRPNQIGLVAVVTGDGLQRIYRGLGTDCIIDGGQTMNPSTEDLLAALESVPYARVLLLPNNGNVIAAANQAVAMATKEVRLVPTLTVPQGISAILAFNPRAELQANLEQMTEAGSQIHTVEVTHAVRDTNINGLRIRQGDVIAVVDDQVQRAGKSFLEVICAALEGLDVKRYELITVYAGSGVEQSEARELAAGLRQRFSGLEVESLEGGQQHYPFILSVE